MSNNEVVRPKGRPVKPFPKLMEIPGVDVFVYFSGPTCGTLLYKKLMTNVSSLCIGEHKIDWDMTKFRDTDCKILVG